MLIAALINIFIFITLKDFLILVFPSPSHARLLLLQTSKDSSVALQTPLRNSQEMTDSPFSFAFLSRFISRKDKIARGRNQIVVSDKQWLLRFSFNKMTYRICIFHYTSQFPSFGSINYDLMFLSSFLTIIYITQHTVETLYRVENRLVKPNYFSLWPLNDMAINKKIFMMVKKKIKDTLNRGETLKYF